MSEAEATREQSEHADVSEYEYSGIQERHGVIPKWLVGVYLVMGVWMVYYLVAYWTDKG